MRPSFKCGIGGRDKEDCLCFFIFLDQDFTIEKVFLSQRFVGNKAKINTEMYLVTSGLGKTRRDRRRTCAHLKNIFVEVPRASFDVSRIVGLEDYLREQKRKHN